MQENRVLVRLFVLSYLHNYSLKSYIYQEKITYKTKQKIQLRNKMLTNHNVSCESI